MFKLSVLIPIYNFDLNQLIQTINYQLVKNNIIYEILLYDDDSLETYKNLHRHWVETQNVKYVELPHNLGRCKIRNKLAQDAQYDLLLFLDCDTQIIGEKYIEKIINYNFENYKVIIGGTCYSEFAPAEQEYYLHWWVGKNKEEKTAVQRNINPYNSFTLNNMVIDKSVFMDIELDENITTYGHEDSKFGEELKNKNIAILHVDNPVCHIGLNENIQFVEKSLTAINNLSNMILYDGIGKETTLYKAYYILRKYKILPFFMFVTKYIEHKLYNNLLSTKPSLIAFDLYKLHYFAKKLK